VVARLLRETPLRTESAQELRAEAEGSEEAEPAPQVVDIVDEPAGVAEPTLGPSERDPVGVTSGR